jgi:hypothetical protein
MLDSIPNYGDYFLIDGFSICEPDKLENEDLQKFDKKCSALKKMKITSSNVNSNLNKLMSLNMPYGGIDVGDYVERTRMDYKKMSTKNKIKEAFSSWNLFEDNNIIVYIYLTP